MFQVDTAQAGSDMCEFAKHRYNGIAQWRFLWTLLLFIFGAFLVVILCGTVALAFVGEPTAAIVTAVAAVVDGAGVTFISARRKDAKDEEEAAYTDVTTKCTNAKPEADAIRKQFRVLGVR